jgi:O-antigen ligase
VYKSLVGNYEAVFGLVAFTLGLPGGAGLQGARAYTSVHNVCPGLISGTLGLSANHMGAMFVLSAPLTLALAVKERGRAQWLWSLSASAQLAALLLTFTRSSTLLGVALVAAFLIYERRFVLLAAVAAATAVLVLSATSVGCVPRAPGPGTGPPPGSVFGDRFSDGNDRLALWYAAGRIMVDHPLYGVGLGLMLDTVRDNPERYSDTPFGPATSSAHNTILLAGAETGVPGALAVASLNILLAVIALRCAWRGRARGDPLLVAAGMVIIGYLVQGMVNNLFSIPATSSLLALLVGGFALPSAEAGPRPAGTSQASPYTPTALESTSSGADH